jgi:hypothetical protein
MGSDGMLTEEDLLDFVGEVVHFTLVEFLTVLGNLSDASRPNSASFCA